MSRPGSGLYPRSAPARRVRILVTGFDRWGDVPENPTAALVRGLDEPDVVGAVLPVSYGRAGGEVRRLIREVRPDAVLGLGLAPGAPAVRVERVALNVAHSEEPDVDGCAPEHLPIDPDGPAAYFTTLPAGEIVSALRAAGIPARHSYHAGTFLCNYVAYVSLREVDLLGWGIAGFMHLPQSSEAAASSGRESPSLPMATLERAVRIALRVLRASPAGSGRDPPQT